MREWQASRDKKLVQRRLEMIPIDKLLMGGDSGQSARRFARLTGDLLRPSTQMCDSPHVKLLQEWNCKGDDVFQKENFEKTAYYNNAMTNIDLFGTYFDARTEDDVVHGAKRFVDCYQGVQSNNIHQQGQSASDDPIRVRPVQYSDCLHVVDGHHRVAIACARGESTVRALPVGPEVLTPLQEMLLEVMWLKGRKELYQPVDFPELRKEWVLVRRCEDRLRKMTAFLEQQRIDNGSYLDVGSSYGWFVAKMNSLGYDAHGVERDPIANLIGHTVYNLDNSRLTRSECSRFLANNPSQYDIVSSFSVLHHFVLGNGRVNAQEFARLLDNCTRRVLFFETGQETEKWYRQRLSGWSPAFIEEWLKASTSFTKIVSLGIDEDDKPPFEGNFGRTLFACLRT